MGAAAAHFWTIGGKPTHLQTFAHTRFCRQNAEQQHALPAGPRRLYGQGLGLAFAGWLCTRLALHQVQHFSIGRCGTGVSGITGLWSRKTFSGKSGVIFSRTQCRAPTGSLPQIVEHGDKISTNKKPAPSRWISSALRIARRAFMMFLLSESATRST
jgi:hypothetical protein